MDTQNNVITLKSGTKLPLMDIKGKKYLPVAQRLVWFREEHKDWAIKTKIIKLAKKAVIMKATIVDERGNTIAMAHKREDINGFSDYIEKAETGAIGRALGMCGYGTQYEPEFDEGKDRIADAPIQK